MEEKQWEIFKKEYKTQLKTLTRSPKVSTHLGELQAANTEIRGHTDDIETLLNIVKKSSNEREATIIMIAAFLWQFEGFYAGCLDEVCFVLITTGHDLYDFFHRKFAKTFRDIGEVDVFTKCKFLEEHNFEMLARDQDRKLRNKFAHHDFSVNDNGKIISNGATIDILKRYRELSDFTSRFTGITLEVYKEINKEIRQKRLNA